MTATKVGPDYFTTDIEEVDCPVSARATHPGKLLHINYCPSPNHCSPAYLMMYMQANSVGTLPGDSGTGGTSGCTYNTTLP